MDHEILTKILRGELTPKRIKKLIAEIHLLMLHFEDIIVTQILRGGNEPANILAKWEDFPKKDCSFEMLPPSKELEKAVRADKDGVWYTKTDKEKKSADK